MVLGFGKNVFADVTVNGSITPQSFPQDRTATLTITVTGSRKSAAITMPEIDNIRFHSRGQSSQISIINGDITSMVSHTYLIQGSKPGKYTLPPITVTAAGKQLKTQPIPFTITARGQKQQQAAGSSKKISLKDIAFIKVSPIGTHYPGEIVPITLKVYLDRNYQTDINTLPVLHGDGVVMEQLSTDPAQSREVINGKQYHVIVWETNLSGIKTGTHPISFSLDGSLLIPQKRRASSPFSNFGRGSLFDDSIFDDFFGNYRREPVTINTPKLTFTVAPLPTENQPHHFSGAIGDFTMQVSASPIKIEVGEPITLKIAISGIGNFDRVEPPSLPESRDWKTYSPTSNFKQRKNSSEGVKTFEQAIVLKSDSLNEIPSLAFSYFDPKKKKYITRSSVPIPLSVQSLQTAVPHSAPSPRAAKPAVVAPMKTITPAPPISGLAPIHLEVGSLSRNLTPLFLRPWYLISCTVLILAAVATLAFRLRQARHRKHPEIQEGRNQRVQLRNNLAVVESAVAAQDSSLFLNECRKTIQNQLGRKYQREPSSISQADLAIWLDEDSVLTKIFTLAEEAVYAGATFSNDEMEEMYNGLKDELESIT